MENTNSQIVQDLIAARDSLTLETWIKGDYFKQKENTLCMCAHGAVQRVVNPVCKAAFNVWDASDADVPVFGGAVAGAGVAAIDRYNDPLQAWNDRPDRIRQDFIFKDKNYGNKELHYLLGMVGLTAYFNDDPNTTLEMVKAKFDEAIALAKLLNI
jgi:hypothetical protein